MNEALGPVLNDLAFAALVLEQLGQLDDGEAAGPLRGMAMAACARLHDASERLRRLPVARSG